LHVVHNLAAGTKEVGGIDFGYHPQARDGRANAIPVSAFSEMGVSMMLLPYRSRKP
jgi:hypothetical protein